MTIEGQSFSEEHSSTEFAADSKFCESIARDFVSK